MSEKQAVAVKLFGALTVHTCPQPFPFKSVLGGGRVSLQGKSTSLKKASRRRPGYLKGGVHRVHNTHGSRHDLGGFGFPM